MRYQEHRHRRERADAPSDTLLANVEDICVEDWMGTSLGMVRHHAVALSDGDVRNVRAFSKWTATLPLYVPVVPRTMDGLRAKPSEPDANARMGAIHSRFTLDDWHREWAQRNANGLLHAAVYIVTRNGPALWYQLQVAHSANPTPQTRALWATIAPPIGSRPLIGWRFFARRRGCTAGRAFIAADVAR